MMNPISQCSQWVARVGSFWHSGEQIDHGTQIIPFNQQIDPKPLPLLQAGFWERLRFNVTGVHRLSQRQKEFHQLINAELGLPPSSDSWWESIQEFCFGIRQTNPVYLPLFPLFFAHAVADAALAPLMNRWEIAKYRQADAFCDPQKITPTLKNPQGMQIYADGDMKILARWQADKVILSIRADEDDFLPDKIHTGIIASWGKVLAGSSYSPKSDTLREPGVFELSLSARELSLGTVYLVTLENEEKPNWKPLQLHVSKPATNLYFLKDYRPRKTG